MSSYPTRDFVRKLPLFVGYSLTLLPMFGVLSLVVNPMLVGRVFAVEQVVGYRIAGIVALLTAAVLEGLAVFVSWKVSKYLTHKLFRIY